MSAHTLSMAPVPYGSPPLAPLWPASPPVVPPSSGLPPPADVPVVPVVPPPATTQVTRSHHGTGGVGLGPRTIGGFEPKRYFQEGVEHGRAKVSPLPARKKKNKLRTAKALDVTLFLVQS
jgi:hypothetical protein